MKSFLIVILLSAGVCLAEESGDKPRSPAAIQAEKKFDTAATPARAAYLQAMIGAEKQFLLDLDVAMKSAMHASNLDEAEKIKSVRADTQSKLESNQAELKNPKGEGEAAAEATPASSDVLTIAAIVAQMPKELRPGKDGWDQQTILKANEWAKANIFGRDFQTIGLNTGSISMTSEDLATTNFDIAGMSGFIIEVVFKERATVARVAKIKHGQRAKLKGLITYLRFDSVKTGVIKLEPAEIVD